MNAESDAARVAALIDRAEFSKALHVLRDAFARSPRHPTLLKVAAKLAGAAESAAIGLASNRATDGSRRAKETEAVAREAKEYLEP